MYINGKWYTEPELEAKISQLVADKKRLERISKEYKELLNKIQPILGRAFFANFMDQDKADELRCRIDQIVGRE